MTDTEIRTQVDEFVALPISERNDAYNSLPIEVRTRARRVLEARRGIAFRLDGGIPVLTIEAYIEQILRLNERLVMVPKKVAALKEKMVEFKRQLQENYGDEALEKAENALESAVTDNK